MCSSRIPHIPGNCPPQPFVVESLTNKHWKHAIPEVDSGFELKLPDLSTPEPPRSVALVTSDGYVAEMVGSRNGKEHWRLCTSVIWVEPNAEEKRQISNCVRESEELAKAARDIFAPMRFRR